MDWVLQCLENKRHLVSDTTVCVARQIPDLKFRVCPALTRTIHEITRNGEKSCLVRVFRGSCLPESTGLVALRDSRVNAVARATGFLPPASCCLPTAQASIPEFVPASRERRRLPSASPTYLNHLRSGALAAEALFQSPPRRPRIDSPASASVDRSTFVASRQSHLRVH